MASIFEDIIVKAIPAREPYLLDLSESDNCMIRVYNQLSFIFFNADERKEFMPSELLKNSLAETLGDFYELAGSLVVLENGSLQVNCNNTGVIWCEQKFESNHELDALRKGGYAQEVIPEGLLSLPTEKQLLKIQLSRFPDQSVILSIAMHHSLADGPAFLRFMECWSSRARGEPLLQPPSDKGLLMGNGDPPSFPHPEYECRKLTAADIQQMMVKAQTKGPDDGRIFVLTSESAKTLKEDVKKMQEKAGITSRIVSVNDALCALLWHGVLKARETEVEDKSMLGWACNIRQRVEPPLPDSYFGNANFYLSGQSTIQDLVGDNGLGVCASIVRASVDGMTPERIQSVLNWVQTQSDKSSILPGFNTQDNDFAITSWANFKVYHDFGSGLPDRVRFPVRRFVDGLAVILPGPPDAGGSLEIVFGLRENTMRRFIDLPETKKYLQLLGN